MQVIIKVPYERKGRDYNRGISRNGLVNGLFDPGPIGPNTNYSPERRLKHHTRCNWTPRVIESVSYRKVCR